MQIRAGGLRLTLASRRPAIAWHRACPALPPGPALLRRPRIDASRSATAAEKDTVPKTHQILATIRGIRRPTQPGLRLMLAVLDDAIETLLEDPSRLRRDRDRMVAEAVAWVQSEDLTWVLSFRSVCEELEID